MTLTLLRLPPFARISRLLRPTPANAVTTIDMCSCQGQLPGWSACAGTRQRTQQGIVELALASLSPCRAAELYC